MDEVDNEKIHLVSSGSTPPTTSNGTNSIEQELTSGDKFLFDFEEFDLSTMALTNNEQNLNPINGNSPEKMDYLIRQEDAKCILKWHFGVKLFRAWIETKNSPIRQRLLQRKSLLSSLSPSTHFSSK